MNCTKTKKKINFNGTLGVSNKTKISLAIIRGVLLGELSLLSISFILLTNTKHRNHKICKKNYCKRKSARGEKVVKC